MVFALHASKEMYPSSDRHVQYVSRRSSVYVLVTIGVESGVLVAVGALWNFCPVCCFFAAPTCVFSLTRVGVSREVISGVITVPEVVEGVAGAVVGVGQEVSVGVGGFGGGGVSGVVGEFQDG